MPSPDQGQIPGSQSQALEQYRQHLLNTAKVHESIITGLAEIRDGLNGLLEVVPESGSLYDDVTILAGGVSKILQGFTDLQSAKIDALQQEAANVQVAIQQAKIQESGIVTPSPTRTRRSN